MHGERVIQLLQSFMRTLYKFQVTMATMCNVSARQHVDVELYWSCMRPP